MVLKPIVLYATKKEILRVFKKDFPPLLSLHLLIIFHITVQNWELEESITLLLIQSGASETVMEQLSSLLSRWLFSSNNSALCPLNSWIKYQHILLFHQRPADNQKKLWRYQWSKVYILVLLIQTIYKYILKKFKQNKSMKKKI